MLEISLLCIYRHTTVVAYMLVTAGSHVEKRSLAAVRISDQSDPDFLAELLSQRVHLALDIYIFSRIGLKSRERLP